MNKIESRHRLIRSLVLEKKIHTQQELRFAFSKWRYSDAIHTFSRH